jgi:hypothetical protein
MILCLSLSAKPSGSDGWSFSLTWRTLPPRLKSITFAKGALPTAYHHRGRCDDSVALRSEWHSPARRRRWSHDVLALPWGFQCCLCRLARETSVDQPVQKIMILIVLWIHASREGRMNLRRLSRHRHPGRPQVLGVRFRHRRICDIWINIICKRINAIRDCPEIRRRTIWLRKPAEPVALRYTYGVLSGPMFATPIKST